MHSVAGFVSFAVFVSIVAAKDVVLPIPGRQQWDDRHGYCGSCSMQTAGLYYGNWLSQDLVRKSVGDDELLPGVNEAKAAKKLKLKTNVWNGDQIASKHQYEGYMSWLRGHLLKEHPVVITIYLSECSDSDYDHIVPAIGVRTSHDDDAYHADDTLVFYNNYAKEHLELTFDDMKGTRKSCKRDEWAGGCIPAGTDWGVAVTGNIDKNGETFPTQLSVNRWDEPDVIKGKKPQDLTGTVKVSGLTANQNYLLLRYGKAASVPSSGFAGHRGNADHVVPFTATGASWTYEDPVGIPSNGAAFYRTVLDPSSTLV